MKLIDKFRYNDCIATQAQLEQVSSMIDDINPMDNETILDDEFDEYILPARRLIEKLAKIVGNRAELFVEGN